MSLQGSIHSYIRLFLIDIFHSRLTPLTTNRVPRALPVRNTHPYPNELRLHRSLQVRDSHYAPRY